MTNGTIRINEQLDQDIVIISPEGSILGGEGAQTLLKLIQEHLRQGKTKFIIDLERVEFVNSMGLGAFLNVRSIVIRQKGTMLIAAPSVHVQELFRITQAEQIFPVFSSVAEAVTELKNFEGGGIKH